MFLFPDRALAKIHQLGEVQPPQGRGPPPDSQASHVRLRAVPPLSRPPPQHLVRGRALSSGKLQAVGRKRGKLNLKLT